MPSLGDGTRPPIDLSRVTESTRRALYDAVVEEHFAPVTAEDAGAYSGPSFSPDAAGLIVFHVFARWFAAWTDLDEPDLPEDRRVQVLRITSRDGGLLFEEV
jgi:hypothetical protein